MRTILAREVSSFGVTVVILTGVFLSPCPLSADSFCWQSVNGQNWNTPIESQFGGTCWDFSSCGNLDAKYNLTRNDPTFSATASEQEVCWEQYMGSTNGGGGQGVLTYFTTHGVVSQAECPYQSSSPNTGIAPYWPLATGWQNRCWKATSVADGFTGGVSPNTTATMKTYLKMYGPLEVGCQGDVDTTTGDLFDSLAAVEGYTGGTTSAMDHEVSLVGYVDDANMANGCGGYWIIKNSWGTGCGVNGTGYYYIPYNNIEVHGDISAITGAVYYTGALKSVTWTGGASQGSIWTTAAGTAYRNWSDGAAWVNQETAATFDTTASNRTIAIINSVFAHDLIFNASGYSLNNSSNGADGDGRRHPGQPERHDQRAGNHRRSADVDHRQRHDAERHRRDAYCHQRSNHCRRRQHDHRRADRRRRRDEHLRRRDAGRTD